MVAPEVGGGFGSKLKVYAEEIARLLAVAPKLGRPVKWIETRTEHMATTHHGRDQIDYVIGAKRDGTITALHTKIVRTWVPTTSSSPFIPSFSAFVMGGCYHIPAVQTDMIGVFTNKMATDAMRGAGPARGHPPHRGDDGPARATSWASTPSRSAAGTSSRGGLSRRDALGIVYDSGDYHGALDKLPREDRPGAFRSEQEELREKGDVPRHRLLHLHGDLRPRALACRRPERLRPAGRLLGVGSRARQAHAAR